MCGHTFQLFFCPSQCFYHGRGGVRCSFGKVNQVNNRLKRIVDFVRHAGCEAGSGSQL